MGRSFAAIALVVWLFGMLVFSLEAAHANEAPSFVNDVEPVLTRFGCNMGACHGKLAGQNGFRLSLRGFAADQDYGWIVREGEGRRINRPTPEESLLLLKPTGKMPHGGGRVLDPAGPGYGVLVAWIQAGSPGPKSEEPRTTHIQVTPSAATLALGGSQPLQVTASYSDGSQRDVTWLTKFESNDRGLISVTPEGIIKAKRHGETAIRAAFDGQVEVAIVTVPFANDVKSEWYAQKNNVIDGHVFSKLESLKIEPAPLCDDPTYLRRVMLDLIGTTPTAAEVRAFLADGSPNKREQLIHVLLQRPEFNDYWALQLGDLFQNRKERDHDVRGMKGVRSLHAWLRQQMVAKKSWKEIASSVLTAQGPANENPAVGYFVVTVGERQAVESEVADSVAQAFLGTRIGCARCHNHPLEKYTQDDYYHFVAFFSRTALERKEPKDGVTNLVLGTQHTVNLRRQIKQEQEKVAKLKAEAADPKMIDECEKRIENWNKEIERDLSQPAQARQPRTGKMMVAKPLDRATVPTLGGDPRQQLVEWMLKPDNEHFAGAIVNRLWKHFLGVGLVEPVDDLRATNPPSNPALWKELVRDFIKHDYDLRRLMRLILQSRTYQLAAETRPSNVTDTRFYSHYYPRRLSAEVLLDALCQATGVPEQFAGYPQGIRAIQLPGPHTDSYFLTIFGRSDRVTACACERNGEVNLSQSLHLQCAELLTSKLASGDSRLNQLLASEPDQDKVCEELFLVTLARLPTEDELQKVREAVRDGDRKEVFTDLMWALVNSKEFAFQR